MPKLFDTIAPRYVDRAGGYTRLLRLGHRRGDSADVAAVELLGSEYDPNKAAKAEKAGEGGDKPKKKTVGGRIREALSGRKKEDQSAARSRSAPRAPRRARRRARPEAADRARRRQRTSDCRPEQDTSSSPVAHVAAGLLYFAAESGGRRPRRPCVRIRQRLAAMRSESRPIVTA